MTEYISAVQKVQQLKARVAVLEEALDEVVAAGFGLVELPFGEPHTPEQIVAEHASGMRLTRALHAAREALGEQTPTATWLVERGQPEKQAPTVWLAGDERPDWYGDWTQDANEARRFETKAAAENFIARRLTRLGHPSARATEHIFVAREALVGTREKDLGGLQSRPCEGSGGETP